MFVHFNTVRKRWPQSKNRFFFIFYVRAVSDITVHSLDKLGSTITMGCSSLTENNFNNKVKINLRLFFSFGECCKLQKYNEEQGDIIISLLK